MSSGTRAFLAALALSLALGYLSVGHVTGGGDAAVSVGATSGGQDQTSEAGSAIPSGVTTSGPVDPGSSRGKNLPPPKAGLACSPGRNGGRTDIGVSATKIRLAATVVQSGPAASLLRESPTGMRAVVDKANATGGICGRIIEMVLRDDGFDQQRGQQFLRTWVTDPAQDIFGLAVVPSAEGLGAEILSGDISRIGMPVVGTDGMRKEQYGDPWVWPVATATVSTMRIMATYGYRKKGARTFAIVWDSKYKFGREGAQEFRAQVKKLGGTIVADRPLNPESPSYATEVDDFNGKCKDGACDMVAMLLLPDTAQKWMSRKPVTGARYTAGAQTLFTDRFAQSCASAAGALCHGLAVWTGYNPPIDRYAGLPCVASYVSDVKAVAPTADVRNQFLEGAYMGMSLMVEALRRISPDVTRERLRAALDSMDYRCDITAGLSWRPNRHHANVQARAFSIVISGGNFLGWRDDQTGWVRDPAFGG